MKTKLTRLKKLLPVLRYQMESHTANAIKSYTEPYRISEQHEIVKKIQYELIWESTASKMQIIDSTYLRKKSAYSVIFIIVEISIWDALSSIYSAFANDNFFIATVIVCPRVDVTASIEYHKMLDFFKEKNINYLPGYNLENDQWIDLSDITPDFIFYTLGSAAFTPKHRIEYTSTFTRTCYIPYGFLLTDQEEYQYNYSFQKAAWRIFCETEFHKKKYIKYQKSPNQVIVSGYPKFDYYQTTKEEDIKKLALWKNNEKKRIIWAPHWTIANISPLHCSSFEKYYNDFFHYIHEHQNIEWLFKPHPNLLYACEKTQLMSRDEYLKYMSTLDSLPNAQTSQLANYFDYFITSDALILDSISFLAEYLPTKKPILFIESSKRPKFNKIGEELISSFYKAYNFTDIINFINNVVLENKDPFYEKRMLCLKKWFYFPKDGAGKRIIKHIKNEIKISKNSEETSSKINHNSMDIQHA